MLSCLEAPIMLPTTFISLEDSRVSVASKLVPELIFVLVCFSIVFLWGLSSVVPVLLGPLGLFMGRLTPSPEARSISDSYLPRGPHSRCDKAIGWRGCPHLYPTGTPDLGNRSPTTTPRESVANADNKLSTGFTPKTPEQTLHEDACDVSLSPIESPFASPMQPAPLLNSKGNLATPEFPNEDSNPMEASRSLEASYSEDSLLSSEKSNPSSTSTPIDLRALYDNKFALLYKEDVELNDPAFQARKREEKQKNSRNRSSPPQGLLHASKTTIRSGMQWQHVRELRN